MYASQTTYHSIHRSTVHGMDQMSRMSFLSSYGTTPYSPPPSEPYAMPSPVSRLPEQSSRTTASEPMGHLSVQGTSISHCFP
jgi:hypothetical protein